MNSELPPSFNALTGETWTLASWSEFLPNTVDPLELKLSLRFTTRDPSGNHVTRTIEALGGCAPWLRLGSIWSHGRLTASQDSNWDTFKHRLGIQADTVAELTLASANFGPGPSGHPMRIPGPIVPRRIHFFGASNTVPLVAVRIEDDPLGLLIPVAELLRFYVCTSTLVAQAIFGGTFLRDLSRIVDLEQTGWVDPGQRIFRIALRYPFDLGDAHVVARFLAAAATQPTRRMYGLPHASIVKNWVNGVSLRPRFAFPFYGATRLEARGKWFQVQTPAGPRKRFLALQLISCSAKFPYDTLQVVRPERTDAESSVGEASGTIAILRATPTVDAAFTADYRADPAVGDWAIAGEKASDRFDDLRRVRTVSIGLKSVSPKRIRRAIIEGPPTRSFTTGLLRDGGTEVGRVRQVLRPEAMDEPVKPSVPLGTGHAYLSRCGAWFVELLAVLNSSACAPFTAATLAFGRCTVVVNGSSFTAFPPLVTGTWHIHDDRRRALFCAIISWQGRLAYLFDIERDEADKARSAMMLAHDADGGPITPDRLSAILDVARRFRRLWSAQTEKGKLKTAVERELSGILFHAIPHRPTKVGKSAEEVVRVIHQAFSIAQAPSHADAGEAGSRFQVGDVDR